MNRSIPSLDGLRTVSITFVIVGHLLPGGWRNGAFVQRLVALFAGNGELGVSIFFGISGFLITTLLVNEYQRSGRVSLARFYVRRAFRIFPAFYCYLAVLLGLSWMGRLEFHPKTWFSALVYLRNYWPPFEGSGDWYTAHAWSLAVEEQFYLLWPTFFAFLGPRRAARLAVVLLVLFPVSRLLTYFLLPAVRPDIGYMTHTKGDALIAGCLAALLKDNATFRVMFRKAVEWCLPFLVLPFLWILSPLLHERFVGVYMIPVGFSLEALSIAFLLLWVVERPETVAGAVLNWKPVVHVGVISYSLYLWQQLFTADRSWWGLFAIFLAAEASFWLVERPFLKLRDRYLTWLLTSSSEPLRASELTSLGRFP